MRRLVLAVAARPSLAGAAAVAALVAAGGVGAAERGCSTDSNGQAACSISTGISGITATDHSTGLPHAVGLQDVDVINLTHRCKTVRLYYMFGFQGDSRRLPAVDVTVGQAAVTDGGPWKTGSASWLTQKVRALLKHNAAPAYIGIEVSNASTGGAHVDRVVAGSPAQKAGLRKGDVIIAVGGVEVTSAAALKQSVNVYRPGGKVILTVLRTTTAFQTATKGLTVTLGALPGAAQPSYSLPYPTSYWYVYVGHTETEALSRGGVTCVHS